MMMTLTKWRSETGLIKSARKLHKDKTFQLMLEVLRNELPTNRNLPAIGVDSGYPYAYAYGAEVGYRQCIAVLEAMTAEDNDASRGEPVASFVGDDTQENK